MTWNDRHDATPPFELSWRYLAPQHEVNVHKLNRDAIVGGETNSQVWHCRRAIMPAIAKNT
jgi:hypothetical protein